MYTVIVELSVVCLCVCMSGTVFSMLHRMQTRSSNENSVRLSFRVFLCLYWYSLVCYLSLCVYAVIVELSVWCVCVCVCLRYSFYHATLNADTF